MDPCGSVGLPRRGGIGVAVVTPEREDQGAPRDGVGHDVAAQPEHLPHGVGGEHGLRGPGGEHLPAAHGEVNIVDNISFTVAPGQTMGLVGESGCGKSIVSMAIMGLLPDTARITGEILFDGKNVLELSPEEHNALRGHDMAMIYQDALSSLNPSMLIKSQLHQLLRRGGKRSAEELLELVGLDPERTLKSYPHELSGGQRQRVLIAMALTRNPRLLIADEPTTALDVTVQHQVVDLLNELRDKLGFSMIFVSHDLALVAKLAHKITVMYAGQVVEQGNTRELLSDPRHEYTRGLLGAVLSIEAGADRRCGRNRGDLRRCTMRHHARSE